MAFPLDGLRVLDFGQGVAGPYCAQLLADHGADVIKVEPPRGDWARTMGAQDGSGLSGTFVSVNRSKRSLCLDLKQREAVEVARALALQCDVVVESFRGGVMDRLGLGYERLRREKRELVYCAVTGFGDSGPNVDLPAGDSTMQAYGGLMSIVGERGGAPLRVANVVSDMLAGTNAFSGVLLALLARAKSGEGSRVGVSLLDSIVAFQAPTITEFLITGAPPKRMGNEHPLIAPSGAVATRDGAIALTVLDHQWRNFCGLKGLERLGSDPRFVTAGDRQRNRGALMAELERVFLERGSDEWIDTLRTMDVLCAPINEYPALMEDAQVRHNRLIGSVPDADGRRVPMIANPVRLGDARARYAPPAALGEHTREILARELRMPDTEIQQLIARGAALDAAARTRFSHPESPQATTFAS